MNKALLSLAFAGTILLTSCGSGMKNSDMADTKTAMPGINNSAEYAKSDEAYSESNDEGSGEASSLSYKQSEVKSIDRQMLIYSCNMSVDVLEFDKAVDDIHELIKKYNGFIENENYSDGGNSSKWQYSDDEKWKQLNATIRVPSAVYEDFCKDAEAIGDLRSKNSSVQNLTTEYSDLKTTLKIYEAKEKRYLDILADIKNEQEAIEVENELTSIQVEIAKIKTRMNNIENDVAYSYIRLTLNEVREYSAKPVVKKTDTFGQRFRNTISGTWDGFLNFLENLLFVIIKMLPYLLLIAAIVFVIVKIIKFFSKIAEKHNKKNYQQKMQQAPPMPQNPQSPQNQPMVPPVNGPVNAPAAPPAEPKDDSRKDINNK